MISPVSVPKLPSYKGTYHWIALGPTLTQDYLIKTSLITSAKPYFQVRSHPVWVDKNLGGDITELTTPSHSRKEEAGKGYPSRLLFLVLLRGKQRPSHKPITSTLTGLISFSYQLKQVYGMRCFCTVSPQILEKDGGCIRIFLSNRTNRRNTYTNIYIRYTISY